MECVEFGPRDQRGLVLHPQLVDGVKGIGKDDALISKPGLENWAVFLCPFLSDESVVVAEFEEGAEDGPTGYFGKAFDLGLLGLVENFPEEVDNGENSDP